MKINKNGKDISVVYSNDNTINVNIFNNEVLMEIVGSFDNNLKEIEKITGSRIFFEEIQLQLRVKKVPMKKLKMLSII